VRLKATVYRAHHPRWSFRPESGAGAASTGGRFNPVGVPALYTSLRLQTAWLEAQQGFAFKAQPMMLCAYDVDCEDVLDLTDTETLRSHGIAPAVLTCPWKSLATRGETPPSWVLAANLIASNVAGIIVPSFAVGATADDINTVFWTWSPDLPHQVRVTDDEHRLPKDDRSWL
jgi:RES domain-containing protein